MKKVDYIYGMHPVMEAIKSGKTIEKVVVQSDLKGPNITELRKLVKTHKIAVQNLPTIRMNHLYKKNHQGVVAFLSPIEYQPYQEVLNQVFETGEIPLFLILDRISDVGNFGAICRTAECMGVHGIIVPVKGSAEINSEAIKRSAGALLNINISKERDLAVVCQELKNSGLKLVGCTEKSDDLIYDADYKDPLAIVMGSEEDGINSTIFKELNEMVKIPMKGSIESLNVSVSTGIILAEACRQRSV